MGKGDLTITSIASNIQMAKSGFNLFAQAKILVLDIFAQP
jgi:hypothetical protein